MPGPTPRQVARAANLARIKEIALAQLATSGAHEVSLRAVARELNVVPSGIYRYFASRDDLITALIVDAYDDLGQTLEEASSRRRSPRRRWVETSLALRSWAVAAPHRFALVYGSAIPGYRAPEDTIAPAGRVVRAFMTAADGGEEVAPARPGRDLAKQLVDTASALGVDADERRMVTLVGAFSRQIGALTLELNGHFVAGFEPADDLFRALVDADANALGLPTS